MKKQAAIMALSIVVLASCGGGSDAPSEPAPVPEVPLPQPEPVPEPVPVPVALPKAGLFVANDASQAGFDLYVDRFHQLTLENGESWIVDHIDALGHPVFFAHGEFKLAYEASAIPPSQPWPWTNVARSDRYQVFSDSVALVATRASALQASLVEIVQTPGTDNLLRSTVFHSAAFGLARVEREAASPAGAAYSFDYDKAARVADIEGAWAFYNPGRPVPNATLAVAASGAFSGANEATGCRYSGTLVPRPSGKNVFNVALTLTDCADAGAYAGVAYRSNQRPMNVYEPGYFVTVFKLMALSTDKTRVFNLQMTPAAVR